MYTGSPATTGLFYCKLIEKMNTTGTQTDSSGHSAAGTEPARICIQGYEGAFHDIAARHCFEGKEISIVPAHTFSELVSRVDEGKDADYGLMAIENSLAGSLMSNYQLLHESELQVTGEVYLRIKQNLMALKGIRLEDLTEVHSHPMAIAQCRHFFRAYPHIRLVESADTALSARHIRDHDLRTCGAIASTLAAEIYGMNILAESIETNKKNHTRFLVLEKRQNQGYAKGADKASVCFAVGHEVGSLHKVLAVLAAYNVNLTKIQSAPIIGKPWEYMFFVDFVVEGGKVGYEQALEAIRPLTHDLKVFGVYRQGKHFDV